MKKLMIALSAVAAAIFAVGTARGDGQLFNAVDFESYTVTAFDASKTDDGASSSGDRYWFSTSNDGNVISNYTDAALSGAAVPDFFKNENVNTNYLYLDTSAPLFRTITNNTQNVSEFEGLPIGDGIYLDTLVKFTAADSAFAEDLTDGDKIAIEYVEHESENAPGDYSYTNFVIRAGYLGNELIQTNYFVAVPEGFNKENWYRLTVRAISGIDGDGHVGFAVYLNGSALAYEQDATIGDNFSATPGAIADLHTARTLYPSAVQSGDDKTTISAASFSGTGAIDDVVFTSIKPGFINEASMVTIRWDTNAVASISIAGTAVTGVDFEAGEKTVPLDGTAILVEATAASNYDLVYTPPEREGAGWNSSTQQFTGLEANDICVITGFVPLFDVGGTHYGTIQAAVAAAQAAGTTAASPATLKLLSDVTGMIQLPSGESDYYVVIDLAGKTIEDTDCAIYNQGAHLTITNSTATIGHVVGALAVAIDQAPTVIAGGSIDGVVDGAGDVQDVVYLTITGGLFLDGDYDPVDNPAFYLADFVVAGQTPVHKEIDNANYFQVGEPPTPPTTYEVTITGTANADYVATVDGSAIASGDSVADGKSVIVVVTPASTHEYASPLPEGWVAGETEGTITRTYTVNGEALAISIPAPTEKTIIGTYQVTVIPTNNTSYAATYSNGDPVSAANDVLTVTVGQTITITVTPGSDYEYATTPTGWTAGANGTITIDVSVAGTVEIPGPTAKQQGGYPTYIDTTDAAEKAKYDAWKALYGDDTGSQYEDAYLLNCDPADVTTEKAAFKFTKIAYENGNWVTETTTKNTDGVDYNGTVTVKRYSDVGCKTESTTGTFFKAELK